MLPSQAIWIKVRIYNIYIFAVIKLDTAYDEIVATDYAVTVILIYMVFSITYHEYGKKWFIY